MRRGVALALLCLAHTHEANAIQPRAGVGPLPIRPPNILHLRGGASKSACILHLRGGASKSPDKQREPALKPKFVAYVIAWAVLPTVLRLAFAAVTMQPLPEVVPTSLQRLGLADAPFALAPSTLPFPERWQLALAAAWIANNLAVVVPG